MVPTNNLEDSSVIVLNVRYRSLFAVELWVTLVTCDLVLELEVPETCAEQNAEETP
jgi:hypothetical protein